MPNSKQKTVKRKHRKREAKLNDKLYGWQQKTEEGRWAAGKNLPKNTYSKT